MRWPHNRSNIQNPEWYVVEAAALPPQSKFLLQARTMPGSIEIAPDAFTDGHLEQ
jgi:hypothetical protein